MKAIKNKGFTIVELIIAMAILSIIVILVMKFMTSSMANYAKSNSEINVQEEAQRTYNDLKDSIMEADSIMIYGIAEGDVTAKWYVSQKYYDSLASKTGYVVFNDKNIEVQMLYNGKDTYLYDSANGNIVYKNTSALGAIDTSMTKEGIFTKYCTSFIANAQNGTNNSVDISIECTNLKRSYTVDGTVTIRNSHVMSE